MTPERWQQIEQIVPGWLAVPETDRGRFLATACGEDIDLRASVEELCSMASEAARFMEQPVVALSSSVSLAVPPPGVDRIGNYRLIGLLGSGGMGTVHRALDDSDRVVRQVAVKLLRDSQQRPETETLFCQERQILATLDHPNIARLVDSGTSPEGRPFLAMEFVDGLPVHQHCDGHVLSSSQRIRIFVKICDAVHYCHSQGVLHRDLKPSNILVTASGEPKLIDFGIAKRQRAPSSPPPFSPLPDSTEYATPLTVDFASPEQVRNQPLGPASDVYALGVLIYLLLTGRLPYDPPTSLLQRLDQICEQPVRPPSEHLMDGAEAGWVEREVDEVVLRALDKSPAERFPSADRLAAVLRACLNDRHRRLASG